jgi:hypothetical protein
MLVYFRPFSFIGDCFGFFEKIEFEDDFKKPEFSSRLESGPEKKDLKKRLM